MRAILAWLAAFAFTQAVEVPIYMTALRGSDPRRSLVARFAIAFGASLITHPIVWFVIPRLWLGHSYWAMVAGAEMFAVIAEALWLDHFKLRRAFLWSLISNASSLSLGLLCRHYFGWP